MKRRTKLFLFALALVTVIGGTVVLNGSGTPIDPPDTGSISQPYEVV